KSPARRARWPFRQAAAMGVLRDLALVRRLGGCSGCWRCEHEELDLHVGADVAVGDEGGDLTARETLDRVYEPMLHRALEGTAGVFDDGASLQLDHRLLDVAVYAA